MLAHPLQSGGVCCVGRRVMGEEKGRGGLPTWRGIDARFVARTWARPAWLGLLIRWRIGHEAAASLPETRRPHYWTVQKVIQPGEERTIEINDGFIHREAEEATFELVSWRFIENPL